jgi:NADH-quinone oxidoreductase subunit N
MITAILPEITVVVLGALILILDLVMPEERRRNLGWVVAAGLVFALILGLIFSRPGDQLRLMWGGMLSQDWLGFTFRMLFLFAAAMTALFSMDLPSLGRRGEYYVLMLASTLGMMLMAASADLIMLYLAIETTSIPLYVLAGFLVKDEKSTESGFKYFLFGAMTSAIMLYGFSLLYGFTGTTNLYLIPYQIGNIYNSLADPALLIPQLLAPLIGILVLILVGFSFKISAVPMHFWAPDVYEGAPTPITGFLSTASKAAGFAVLLRVMITSFPMLAPYWGAVIAALAVATMTLGNLLALAQKNIKRMLAYSSIAHAGYIMIGLVAFARLGMQSPLGTISVVYYLIVYLVTNLAAFATVSASGRITGSDEIASYAGLSRRAPYLSLALLISFLSLAGMPPFGGFIVKFSVFAAAVQADMIWLAVIGVLNSIVGLYYYLTVLKYVYLYRSEDESKPLPVTRPYALGIGLLCLGIILIGTVIAPWITLSASAASSLF